MEAKRPGENEQDIHPTLQDLKCLVLTLESAVKSALPALQLYSYTGQFKGLHSLQVLLKKCGKTPWEPCDLQGTGVFWLRFRRSGMTTEWREPIFLCKTAKRIVSQALITYRTQAWL